MTKRTPLDNPILAEHAAEIRRLGKRVVADVIEIGRRLSKARGIAGHGNWLPWLERELKWTDMTATRFINVYEMSKSNNLLDLELPISGLYLLAARSTPAAARDEIIDRARKGDTVPVAETKRIIEDAKDKQRQPKRKRTPQAAPAKEKPRARDDIGSASAGEAERLRVRVEELQADKRRLEVQIEGLRSEAKAAAKPAPESKSASWCSICHKKKPAVLRPIFICDSCVDIYEIREAAPAGDDGLDIPEFLRRGTGDSHG